MNRKLVFFCAGFAAQLLLTQLFEFKYMGLISAAFICVIGLSFVVLKYFKQGVLLILGAALALGWFLVYPNIFNIPDMPEDKTRFSAQAIDYSFDNNKKTGIVCDAEILSVDGKMLERPFTARIYLADKNESLSPGDEFCGTASFEIPVNDEDFKAFTYYKTRGIDVILFCDEVSITGNNDSLRYLPKHIAYAAKLRIDQLAGEGANGFIKALILGDKRDFSASNQENFTITGLAHVVAVSGMHIVFLAGFIILIFGRRRAIYIAGPILILFALVIGNPPSVMRAVIMQFIVMISAKVRRESDSITSISAALFIILAINPYSVMDVGLQLSFLATIGIVLCAHKLNFFFLRPFKIKQKWLFKTVNFFTSTLATSIVATVFTTPVIAIYFRSISLIGPICNLFLIWIINAIFILAIVGLALSFVFLPIGQFIFAPAVWMSNAIFAATELAAGIPFATVYIDNVYSIAFVIYFYIVIFIALSGDKKQIVIPSCCMLIALGVAILFTNLSNPDFDGLRFTVLDVGQGASMIADDNDSFVMVDCGGDKSQNVGAIARTYLRKVGADKIDKLILTHMHDDHTSGVSYLLERFEVSDLYVYDKCSDDPVCESIVSLARRNGTCVHYVSENMTIPMDDWEIRLYTTGWRKNDNENGLVVMFDKDDFEVVATGDLSQKSEMLLCENNQLPDSEVYIAGHHGSESSSSLKLMNTILPEHAIISVGADNYYGHPHEKTLYLFGKMGIKVHRTDEEGTIVFYSQDFVKGET